MTSPTPSRLADERLVTLIHIYQTGADAADATGTSFGDTLSALRELQQRRAAESSGLRREGDTVSVRLPGSGVPDNTLTGMPQSAAESADRWVPWNCNSSPPPERGRWYWTSKVSRRGKQAFSEEECFFGEPDECWKDGWHSSWIVRAYWSRPLPPPYAPSSPDGEKGR